MVPCFDLFWLVQLDDSMESRQNSLVALRVQFFRLLPQTDRKKDAATVRVAMSKNDNLLAILHIARRLAG